MAPRRRPVNNDYNYGLRRRRRRSILRSVIAREHGLCDDRSFGRAVARRLWDGDDDDGAGGGAGRSAKTLLSRYEVVSPHRRSVTGLDLSNHDGGRFLLAGSADGTVSVYDLSPWGSDRLVSRQPQPHHHQHHHATTNNDNSAVSHPETTFRPVARSCKVPAPSLQDEVSRLLQLPAGHSSSITYVGWYPTDDAGAFVSAATDGCVLLWDTARMKPVLRIQPFGGDDAAGGTSSGFVVADLRGCAGASTAKSTTTSSSSSNGDDGHHGLVEYHAAPLLAVGSWNDANLKLVDIRSGAASHQLVGHAKGISAVQWSPSNSHIVASGSCDATIRLWDIRMSGSRACLTTLNRERVVASVGYGGSGSYHQSVIVRGYKSDYSHLRRDGRAAWRSSSSPPGKRKRPRRQQQYGHDAPIAPNNYDRVQLQSAVSHRGHVASLQFFNGGQRLASVGGMDGELLVWDLVEGALLPNKFVAPGGLPATAPRQRRVALCVEDRWDNHDKTTIWISRGGHILGFPVDGGSPKQILRGHLANVSSLELNPLDKNLFSGSADGMILTFGSNQLSGTSDTGGDGPMGEDQDDW